MIQRGITALDFLYTMTDDDFHDVIEMGEIDSFCNALTLDLNELETGMIKNKA